MSGVSLPGIDQTPRAAQPVTAETPRAVVFGCLGTVLGDDERRFFREANPLGFILFKRNVESPEQVKALISDLRAAVGRDDAPVLIDQEGGRVARLRPPDWPAHPPARCIGALAERSLDQGLEAAWLNGRLLAAMLHDLGITVDCTPVCDVPVPHAHDVIGDRAFSDDPALVSTLARACCDGLLAGGVLPVIKHIPGHGRARTDSHEELPVVDESRTELDSTDFVPFRALADQAMGMVAHVVYRAIDPRHPASTSPTVIGEVVRQHLGFDGLLFSDDLSMGALDGSPAARAVAVLEAGCDIALHCNGTMAEMREIAAVMPYLEGQAGIRWQRARGALQPPQPMVLAEARARLDQLLLGVQLDPVGGDWVAVAEDPTTRRRPPAGA
ncbi:MAG: beta-N-acetylhexosaminidase [Rhodospirillaceae bacterium]